MVGKAAVFIVIAVIIIALILTWVYLQHVIEEYDVDRAINDATYVLHYLKTIQVL